ncbi:YbaB/EbfC family nucleoid-associated protein [Catenuloplanes indicus]|uniref:DNA-binding protein YbaB n=1 Tax=Catenuloplanes indicus TaxID=137267 RepID=A0AAE3VZU7_9ACTN|nr:YbaB/EbfC family nucleoid-associated protein [Catenuloplanes indicus]MDQ0366761.1 DNA-binding protein YbaB [Catenuloplanes indicus]
MAQQANRDANAALKARFADVYGQYEKLRDGMGEMQTRLASLSVSAADEDELIRATVGPRGQLTSLEIAPRAYRVYEAHELAEAITRVVAEAAANATDAVQEVLGDYLPAGTGAMDYLKDGTFGSLLRHSDSRLRETGE